MIKTTRLRDSQVPQNKVYDLSPQCNGQRTVFQLPKRVFPSDKFWLILNGKTLRNDINHTFYTVGLQGTQLTIYFPAPTGSDVLQVVLPNNSEGVQPFATEEYAEAVADLAKQAAIADSKAYTDAELQSQYNTLHGEITTEAGTRADADTALGGRVDTEADARERADTNLQQQIDAVVAKSDVVDIVGTYADLMAYDTSDLGDKDEIKVIADETHNDAISYYRWSTSTETWSYVGSEGPYLTKSEAATDYVPQTRTVNGKALSSNVNLTAQDIGAATPSDLPTKTSYLQNDGSDGTSTYVEADDLATTLDDYYTKTDVDDVFATKQELEDLVGDIGDILDAVHGGNIAIIEVPAGEGE